MVKKCGYCRKSLADKNAVLCTSCIEPQQLHSHCYKAHRTIHCCLDYSGHEILHPDKMMPSIGGITCAVPKVPNRSQVLCVIGHRKSECNFKTHDLRICCRCSGLIQEDDLCSCFSREQLEKKKTEPCDNHKHFSRDVTATCAYCFASVAASEPTTLKMKIKDQHKSRKPTLLWPDQTMFSILLCPECQVFNESITSMDIPILVTNSSSWIETVKMHDGLIPARIGTRLHVHLPQKDTLANVLRIPWSEWGTNEIRGCNLFNSVLWLLNNPYTPLLDPAEIKRALDSRHSYAFDDIIKSLLRMDRRPILLSFFPPGVHMLVCSYISQCEAFIDIVRRFGIINSNPSD